MENRRIAYPYARAFFEVLQEKSKAAIENDANIPKDISPERFKKEEARLMIAHVVYFTMFCYYVCFGDSQSAKLVRLPTVAKDVKKLLIEEMIYREDMPKDLADKYAQFLKVCIQEDKYLLLKAIVQTFQEIALEEYSIYRYEITSFTPISRERVLSSAQALAKTMPPAALRTDPNLRWTMVINVRVNKSLLGGFRVQQGSTVRDASLYRKIGKFATYLRSN